MNMCHSNLSQSDSLLLERPFKSEYKDLVDYARFILYYGGWAEDAVQEVFMIGTKKISDLRDSTNQVGWLYRTLQYVVSNKNRETQRINKLVEKITKSPETKDIGVTLPFESQTLIDEEYMRLLKEPDWSMFKDFFCNGYKYNDLAKKYGKSISACKMRIMRAKNVLAEKLRGNFDE